MRDIGKNIRDLRERAGLTQEAMAEKLFVTRQTVSNYETGKTRPDLDMLVKIAEILGTDANTVLYGLPVPPDRQRALKHLTITGGGFFALLTVLLILRPIANSLAVNEFRVALSFWLRYIVSPVLWSLGGYGLMTLMKLALNLRPRQAPWARWVRIGLLAIWGFCLLLMVPSGIFHIVADIRAELYSEVQMHFSMGAVLNGIYQAIMRLTYSAAPLWTLPGILYALLQKEESLA